MLIGEIILDWIYFPFRRFRCWVFNHRWSRFTENFYWERQNKWQEVECWKCWKTKYFILENGKLYLPKKKGKK